jgi:hypothetical protein
MAPTTAHGSAHQLRARWSYSRQRVRFTGRPPAAADVLWYVRMFSLTQAAPAPAAPATHRVGPESARWRSGLNGDPY